MLKEGGTSLATDVILGCQEMKGADSNFSYFIPARKGQVLYLNYNGMTAVRQGMGIAISLNLACTYDDLVFLPLIPALEHSSVLAWKKNQPHTKTIDKFIEFAKKRLLS